MRTRTSSFLVTWTATTTAAVALLVGSEAEPAKANADPRPDAAAVETKPSDAASPPAAPARQSGLKKADPQTKFSFGVDEVAKMYQSGVETDVILNYIQSSNVPYHPSADEVVRLHDLGVPSQIITTLIRHGAQVQQQAASAYAQSQQKTTDEAKAASAYVNTYPQTVYSPPPPALTYTYPYPSYVDTAWPLYSSYYYYPRYCYSSPFYFRFGYPGYGRFGSYGGFRSYPRFGFGGHFGFGAHVGFGHVGGFHGIHAGRHR